MLCPLSVIVNACLSSIFSIYIPPTQSTTSTFTQDNRCNSAQLFLCRPILKPPSRPKLNKTRKNFKMYTTDSIPSSSTESPLNNSTWTLLEPSSSSDSLSSSSIILGLVAVCVLIILHIAVCTRIYCRRQSASPPPEMTSRPPSYSTIMVREHISVSVVELMSTISGIDKEEPPPSYDQISRAQVHI